jgi:hypothetical protein
MSWGYSLVFYLSAFEFHYVVLLLNTEQPEFLVELAFSRALAEFADGLVQFLRQRPDEVLSILFV